MYMKLVVIKKPELIKWLYLSAAVVDIKHTV